MQDRIDALLKDLGEGDPEPATPQDLATRIKRRLKADPTLSWDAALREIAEREGRK